MELIAYILGLIVRTIFTLPGPVLALGIILVVGVFIFQAGRHNVIMADFRDEVARAVAKRDNRW